MKSTTSRAVSPANETPADQRPPQPPGLSSSHIGRRAFLAVALGVSGAFAASGNESQAVNGLRLSVIEKALPLAAAPVGAVPQKVLYLRWENVGKAALSVRRDRCCDLYDHVFVKGPDGALLPARKDNRDRAKHPTAGRIPVEPGKADEEVFDPWHWVVKPEKPGKYEVWVEFESKAKPQGGTQPGEWTGKVSSNHQQIEIPASRKGEPK